MHTDPETSTSKEKEVEGYAYAYICTSRDSYNCTRGYPDMSRYLQHASKAPFGFLLCFFLPPTDFSGTVPRYLTTSTNGR